MIGVNGDLKAVRMLFLGFHEHLLILRMMGWGLVFPKRLLTLCQQFWGLWTLMSLVSVVILVYCLRRSFYISLMISLGRALMQRCRKKVLIQSALLSIPEVLDLFFVYAQNVNGGVSKVVCKFRPACGSRISIRRGLKQDCKRWWLRQVGDQKEV